MEKKFKVRGIIYNRVSTDDQKKFKKEDKTSAEKFGDEMSKCFEKYSKIEIEKYRAHIKSKINAII